MNRRRFLASLGVGGLTTAAGCLGGRTVAPPTAGDERSAVAYREVDLPVPEEDLVRSVPKDGIPAITDPEFGPDWSNLEVQVTGDIPTLDDDEEVVGIDVDGVVRAYPLAILNWHEIVNDVLPTVDGDRPLLVTFCPLCNSAVVADRTIDGTTTTFGVSGYLYESDLVMYDTATESLWSQVLAQSIRGPLTGTELSLLPNTFATWGEWRGAHPDTEVLLPPPDSGTIVGRTTRDYDRNPYNGYGGLNSAGLGYNDDIDGRLPPKLLVVGVSHRGTARAYPLDRVEKHGVVNDAVAGLPVVVTTTAGGSLVAYLREVDGRRVRFSRDGDALVGAGSRWDPTSGRALDGPHEGTTLTRANDRSPMFWFAWADFFPETDVWRA